MDRKTFLKSLAFIPLAGKAMQLTSLSELGARLGASEKMPVLFVGHGNPMNAITDNPYSKTWTQMGATLGEPKAILCISAHWLTRGTAVTLNPQPITIHDFGGFPDELFKVQYPAKGAVDYAKLAIEGVKSTKIHEDFEWGLDHGAWSVLKSMYPNANVPVFQMSIDYGKPLQYHYDLAKELGFLRESGVLIVASGNVVHNLGMISWNDPTKTFDWAIEFDQFAKKNIESGNHQALIQYQTLGRIADLAHPSNDHYIPLIYALGLKRNTDGIRFFNDSFDLGSIGMRSVLLS